MELSKKTAMKPKEKGILDAAYESAKQMKDSPNTQEREVANHLYCSTDILFVGTWLVNYGTMKDRISIEISSNSWHTIKKTQMWKESFRERNGNFTNHIFHQTVGIQ